ncbi:protein-tyrosine phosphatase-like protein [Daedaleopsis nitida]|nr:protein-tyrosine phosphatase-like protein [Daedaleopsis nitida]
MPYPRYDLDPLVHIPSRIFPRLWLSSRSTAVDATQLAALNVTHIVSVIERQPKIPRMHNNPTTVHYALQDSEDADILRHLGSATAFIRAALSDPSNVVLVHCERGISRSPTIVCAYLIATLGYAPQTALEYVVARRQIVSPIRAFLRQLASYAARLCPGRQAQQQVPKALPLPSAPS